MSRLIRIWDLPTRIFHWTLVACVMGLVVSAEFDFMDWHFRLGYTVLALLLFRLIWGVAGGHWSRFSSFLYSPATVRRYLRGQGEPAHSAGHSPTGALSVYALLLFLAAQVASGLFSDDEIAASGPLTAWVSGGFVSKATWYHGKVGKLMLIVLVALHVAAVVYHLWRKGENLVRPMITGDKELPESVPPSRDDLRTRLVAAAALAAAAGLVLLLLRFAPGA